MDALSNALGTLSSAIGESRTGTIMDAAANRLASSIAGKDKTSKAPATTAAPAAAAPAASGRPAWLLPAAFGGVALLLILLVVLVLMRRGRK